MVEAQATRATEGRALPKPVGAALGRVDRRLKWVALLKGLGTLAVAGAAVAGLGMAADVAWKLPTAVRWGVWAGWLVVVAVLLFRAVRGLSGRPNGRGVGLAALTERATPGIGERLTAAVGLLGGGATPNGSPGLLAAVADDAAAHANSVDARLIVPGGAARRRFAVGGVAVAALVLPVVVRPDPYATLARRFFAPWSGGAWPGSVSVVVRPGDGVAAAGGGLPVRAEVLPRFLGEAPGSAMLEWTDPVSGRTRRRAMELDTAWCECEAVAGAKAFDLVLPLPATPGVAAYRVVTPRGESPWFRLEGLAPPSVLAVSARVEPPPYTGLPAREVADASGLDVWEGSAVRLRVKADRPLSRADVDWPATAESEDAAAAPRQVSRPAVVGVDGRAAELVLTAEVSGEFGVRLTDRKGVAGRPEPPRRLAVRVDRPPTLVLKGVPESGTEEARGDDVLRVGLSARDDLGVASAELRYTIERAGGGGPDASESDAERVSAVTLTGAGTTSASGVATLDLKPLKLRPGDSLGYRVGVSDNRPAPKGPNVSWSDVRRVAVSANAPPLAARRAKARRDAVQAKLDALKQGASENRRETEPLRYAADAVSRGNGAWDADRKQALADREAGAREVAEGLKTLANALEADPSFRSLARPARQAGEVEAEAARETLRLAAAADDPAKRLADLRQADARLGAVSSRLDDLQRGLDGLARRDVDRQKLNDLADRQARVADRAEAEAKGDDPADPHAPPDRARLDRAAAEQNGVKKDLDSLLREAPGLRAGVLAGQSAEADELARRARELAARQRDEARVATDLSPKTAALRRLAVEQRAIETEARRLALDVDAALSENGRAPFNAGPAREAAAPIERAEMNQARQRLSESENELRRLARDLREVPTDPKALARRLARRQDALSNETIQALGDQRNKDRASDADAPALAARLKAVAAAQAALAGLAGSLAKSDQARDDRAKPPFPRDLAARAADTTAAAAKADGESSPSPRRVEARANEARETLHRLANELPDPWKRSEPSRHALNQAREAVNDALNQMENHLREAEAESVKEPARAAERLAERLSQAAEKAERAAARLDEDAPSFAPRLAPARGRAVGRLRALAKLARDRPEGRPGLEQARVRRDAVGAAAVEARAGLDRLDQALNGQPSADALAAELAAERKAARARPADPAAKADDHRRLSSALRTIQTPDAALEKAEAVRLADLAARAFDAANDADTAKAADALAEKATEAVATLADRLNDRQSPRARVEALARAERGDFGKGDPRGDLAASAALQKGVGADLERVSGRGDAKAKAAEAVSAARRMAEHPDDFDDGRPEPADLAASRAKVADALDALAKTLPNDPPKSQAKADPKAPADPELTINAGHADRAEGLARRERQLRERLQALLGERAGPQEALKAESTDLATKLADLRDRAKGVSPRAGGPAGNAASLLGEQAPGAMDQAVDHLVQGLPEPARDAQRRAAELAERGAQAAEDLAAVLRQDAKNDAEADANAENLADAKHKPAGGEEGEAADPLSAARAAMARAARRLGQARGERPDGEPPSAALRDARQAMRGAADRLRQAAATSEGSGPGAEADADAGLAEADAEAGGGPARDPKSGRAGVAAAASLPEIQEQVRKSSGRNWGELPGHLRTEILQMTQGRYRDDYARLIQLYFREIAAGAASPGARP